MLSRRKNDIAHCIDCYSTLGRCDSLPLEMIVVCVIVAQGLDSLSASKKDYEDGRKPSSKKDWL